MTPTQTQRLIHLLAQPTAPFREQHVIRHAEGFLESCGIPHFRDPIGNIVTGARSRTEYLKLVRCRSKEPLRLFIAHMDHPGFHGMRWLDRNHLRIRWHGGSPVKHLHGARVRLVDDSGTLGEASFARVRKHKTGRAIETADIRIPAGLFEGRRRPAARSLFGGFAFRAPAWQERGRVYCPAADDLVGVFAILETMHLLWTHGQQDRPFLGLLTRGEEVGFTGAVGHLELNWLQKRRRPVIAVSLEASRTLPGAAIGKGPVVRLGDRRTVFDADALKVLSDLAEKALGNAHQRRIMDGGSCEATAVTAWGLPAIGISVPLGNYHNQGYEGGPDCKAAEGPAPEFVHLNDVAGLLRLCQALMQPDLNWGDPWAGQRRSLQANLEKYRKLLG